jgi:hypothetical protein
MQQVNRYNYVTIYVIHGKEATASRSSPDIFSCRSARAPREGGGACWEQLDETVNAASHAYTTKQ